MTLDRYCMRHEPVAAEPKKDVAKPVNVAAEREKVGAKNCFRSLNLFLRPHLCRHLKVRTPGLSCNAASLLSYYWSFC